QRRLDRVGGVVEFLADYAGFLARTVTIVVATLVVLAAIAALRGRNRARGGHLEVRKLNDFFTGLRERLELDLLEKSQLKARRKSEAKAAKAAKKSGESKPRVYVLDFDGDIRASAVEHLRHEITALLSVATPADEVVLRLESPGGMVHGYG